MACDEPGLADDVSGPEATALAREHLYRALDFLRRHLEAIAPALGCRTAALGTPDVARLFWDTPTRYCKIDAEDEDGEQWPDTRAPRVAPAGPE